MLLSVKLKNLVKKNCPPYLEEHLVFHLRNTKINGKNIGCSGFIQNTKNGNIVYVNTEKKLHTNGYLVRVASSLKDYCGKRNFFYDIASYPLFILDLLEN